MPPVSNISRFNRLPVSCVALIFCALAISGCGSSAESHEDEHDHEHEHLEHFVPAHKPKHFSDLVEQLALRVPQLQDGSQPGASGGNGHATALQEFSEIIGWIPELAADSELLKADFESAVATGNKLVAVYAETLGPQKTKPFDAATFEPLIVELRKLAPKSQDRKDQM